MLNSTILIKVKQRLNKLASNDYDNILDWQIIEAFNKAQSDWVRRNLHGINMVKEGDEQSNKRIDDLQILLNTVTVPVFDIQTYFESQNLPADYMQYKRLSAEAFKECCPPRKLIVYLAEQQNTDLLLRDKNKRPSYDWAETFATFKNNKFQIYTNGEFQVINVKFTYYRQPNKIQITGVTNPYTNVVSTTTVPCEFKDDVAEVLIDECSKIIAGDIESLTQYEIQSKSVESNN